MAENESDEVTEIKYLATFVRGNFHGLRDLSWDVPGRCIVISETQMVHLEEHAVDYVTTGEGESLSKERFKFELYDGEHPVGYKFPTEIEASTAEAQAASLARGRRNLAAKARVDTEMQNFEATYTPSARPRARLRLA